MERMFGATCNATPVTRSVDVGTAEALTTSAASPVPRCADGTSPGRSMRGATAAPGSALAAAAELVLFFFDDDELRGRACVHGGRTSRSRHGRLARDTSSLTTAVGASSVSADRIISANQRYVTIRRLRLSPPMEPTISFSFSHERGSCSKHARSTATRTPWSLAHSRVAATWGDCAIRANSKRLKRPPARSVSRSRRLASSCLAPASACRACTRRVRRCTRE